MSWQFHQLISKPCQLFATASFWTSVTVYEMADSEFLVQSNIQKNKMKNLRENQTGDLLVIDTACSVVRWMDCTQNFVWIVWQQSRNLDCQCPSTIYSWDMQTR